MPFVRMKAAMTRRFDSGMQERLSVLEGELGRLLRSA